MSQSLNDPNLPAQLHPTTVAWWPHEHCDIEGSTRYRTITARKLFSTGLEMKNDDCLVTTPRDDLFARR